MKYEYVLEEGTEHDFYYNGHWYVAYTRLYNTGDFDVEVILRDFPDAQVNDEIYEYAWNLFEDMGLI